MHAPVLEIVDETDPYHFSSLGRFFPTESSERSGVACTNKRHQISDRRRLIGAERAESGGERRGAAESAAKCRALIVSWER